MAAYLRRPYHRRNDDRQHRGLADCLARADNVGVLTLALAISAIALIALVFTEVINEPAAMVVLLVILRFSVGLDIAWTWSRASSGNDHDRLAATPAT